MVGDHRDQFAAQSACAPTEDQVVEAVAHLRDHHQDAGQFGVDEPELHAEFGGDRAEIFGQPRHIGVVVIADELGPQEEGLAARVVELLMLGDVASAREQEGTDRVDDPRALRAAQGQGEVLRHGISSERPELMSGWGVRRESGAVRTGSSSSRGRRAARRPPWRELAGRSTGSRLSYRVPRWRAATRRRWAPRRCGRTPRW